MVSNAFDESNFTEDVGGVGVGVSSCISRRILSVSSKAANSVVNYFRKPNWLLNNSPLS